ncbi:RNA-binding S4 domain-containing protein [Sphingomonas sp. RB3P16]|uniref:RNA-binding S4 domain-containing protein n=1 Tax=Parasphingomonas frigoris TaxID=3096163 RepID=UPI002FCB1645
MRIDRFLWFARIVKTRGIAQDMAASGHVRIDGRAIDKPAAPVRIGCVIAFASPSGRVRALRVEALPARRGPPEEARGLYSDLLENARSERASVDAAGARA